MRNHRVSLIVATVATALALLPTTVQADVITEPVDVRGLGLYSTASITYSPAGFNNTNVYAGQILVGYKGEDYASYCVDIFQWAGGGPVTEASPTSLPHGDLAAWLFETYAPTVTTGTQAAALQVAIWEVLYENPQGGYFISSGSFTASNNSQVTSAAQGLLNSLPGSHTPLASTILLASGGYQDLMISSGTGGAPVPEPGPMALLALGGAMTILRRRRCA